ncbi:MAG: aminotransferase class V-fold PLP-dependent enzyme [Candidatus Helarchaeota archaeon]
MAPLTPEQVREHIPIMQKYIYLDNAATTPVPIPILEAVKEYIYEYPANIERGAYSIAAIASEKVDEARENIAKLLLNCSPHEFIFTRNETQGGNFVAHALLNPLLERRNGVFTESECPIKWEPGDEIVTTIIEHHSNMLPWMRLARQVKAEYKLVEPNRDGILRPDDFTRVLSEQTKLVAFQHASNVMGTIHPIATIIKQIREINPHTLIFIDGSQAPGHMKVNVKALGCDFYTFSGHKGPLSMPGTGGLYIKEGLIERLDPEEIGGGIIADVAKYDYKLRSDSYGKRWDAGTPNIVGYLALGRAAIYVAKEIGLKNIERQEAKLMKLLLEEVAELKNFEFYGPQSLSHRGGVFTFNIKGWNSHELSLALDEKWKILTRGGHHCAIPTMRWLGIHEEYGGNTRASFHYFNLESDVEKLIEALKVLCE